MAQILVGLLLLYSHVRASIQEATSECIPTNKNSSESPGTAGAGCDHSNSAASKKTGLAAQVLSALRHNML
jgi:hypothetical protein